MKKAFSTKYTTNSVSVALLLLRIGMGGLMIPYGYKKLTHFSSWSGGFADPFHIGSGISLALVIFAEFFCAFFVLTGLMTRLACIPIIITMTVALSYSHNWDVFGDGQKAALFLSGFLALLFTGPGRISLDRLIGK